MSYNKNFALRISREHKQLGLTALPRRMFSCPLMRTLSVAQPIRQEHPASKRRTTGRSRFVTGVRALAVLCLFSGFGGQAFAGTKATYNASGSDQTVTAPAGAEGVRVKAWGAGGGHEVAGSLPSGAGGYTEGEFDHSVVTSGSSFTVVVGEGGNKFGRVPDGVQQGVYGFGSVSNHEQGGGLSGLFSGSGTVTATSSSRALIVSGRFNGYRSSWNLCRGKCRGQPCSCATRRRRRRL